MDISYDLRAETPALTGIFSPESLTRMGIDGSSTTFDVIIKIVIDFFNFNLTRKIKLKLNSNVELEKKRIPNIAKSTVVQNVLNQNGNGI